MKHLFQIMQTKFRPKGLSKSMSFKSNRKECCQKEISNNKLLIKRLISKQLPHKIKRHKQKRRNHSDLNSSLHISHQNFKNANNIKNLPPINKDEFIVYKSKKDLEKCNSKLKYSI